MAKPARTRVLVALGSPDDLDNLLEELPAPCEPGNSWSFPLIRFMGWRRWRKMRLPPDPLAAKGRDRSVALPVMVAGIEQVTVVAHLLPGFEALASAFWPGPLTIIPAQDAHPAGHRHWRGRSGRLAGSEPQAGAGVAATCASPLAVTSANRGQPPAQSAAAALDPAWRPR